VILLRIVLSQFDAAEGWRSVRMRPAIAARLTQRAGDPDSTWDDPDLEKPAA
jgi:hypothetical protein